jgi:predicted alpha-1,6-mannanase (GH76 family)
MPAQVPRNLTTFPRLPHHPILSRVIVIALAVASTLGCVFLVQASSAVTPEDHQAASAAAGLQTFYQGSYYRSAQWWQSANALEATIDYMQASGSRKYLGNLARIYRAHHDSDRFLDSYYDDDGWWALAWIKAYDLTRDRRYLRQAQSIFETMTDGWDNTCGGGIWWSKNRSYKNAIANELFLKVAAELHNRVPGDTWYAGWAAREWAWFRSTGMLTRSGLVIDGLAITPQGTCRPALNSPTWTYNQGVLIGGLIALGHSTRDPSMLATARRVAGAVIRSPALSPHGVLREPCEAASSCDADQPQFKGIFIRNLRVLYNRTSDPAYRSYLRRNAVSVWHNDRRADQFGLSWSGPFDRAGAARQVSALDALTAGIFVATPGRHALP